MSLSVIIKKKLKGFYLDIDFKTNGENLGILGASGSGKSMTLKCIAGVETPDEGRIVFNSKVLFDSEKKINVRPQDRKIGYLFQSYALFPNMTAEENIGVGLKLSKQEKKVKINELIKLFHLEGMAYKYPSQLSGGQQQRVALARIFAYEPDILLLDEPFSALDSYLKEQLQNEVLEFLQLYKGEVLMVTHSREEVYKFCKNLVIIDEGKTVLMGETKEIFKQPKLLAAARLTGCKNFSRCNVLTSHSIYAVDWDISLETEKTVPKGIKYIGIYSHDFCIVDNEGYDNTDNIMVCKVCNLIEGVFDYTILVEVKSKTKQNKSEACKVWLTISKEEWDSRSNKENLHIRIPEDAILMLE